MVAAALLSAIGEVLAMPSCFGLKAGVMFGCAHIMHILSPRCLSSNRHVELPVLNASRESTY